MILKFEYKSVSRFSTAVCNHAFLLRNQPLESDNQHITYFHIEVMGCKNLYWQNDCFGNTFAFGNIQDWHNEFLVLSHGIVEHTHNKDVAVPNPVFCYPSPLVVCNDEIADFAAQYRGDTVAQTASNLCAAVNAQIAYRSGTTNVQTDSASAFAQQTGVCQDISHVFIAALRSLKIPARYVAGYAKGLHLSHAWTEVYYNGCWHGYDATENTCNLSNYIKIAQGRDASDCPLNRGIFTGSATETNEIEINVEND
ncbi:MAG: hypothetical protein K6F33_04745 [Bacteroidales bacterium]|nr:hypothetical protein [Bacteroidales bacterium]